MTLHEQAGRLTVAASWACLALLLVLVFSGCAPVVAPDLSHIAGFVGEAKKKVRQVIPHVVGEDRAALVAADGQLVSAQLEVKTRQAEVDRLATAAAEIPSLKEKLHASRMTSLKLGAILGAEVLAVVAWLWYRGTVTAAIRGIKGAFL